MSKLAALIDVVEKLGIYTGTCGGVGGGIGFLSAFGKWWITQQRPDVLVWSGWGTGFGVCFGLVLYAVTA